jgi:hypothetical protein
METTLWWKWSRNVNRQPNIEVFKTYQPGSHYVFYEGDGSASFPHTTQTHVTCVTCNYLADHLPEEHAEEYRTCLGVYLTFKEAQCAAADSVKYACYSSPPTFHNILVN